LFANSVTTFNPGVGLVPPPPGDPLRNMLSVTRSRPREYGITFQHNFAAH